MKKDFTIYIIAGIAILAASIIITKILKRFGILKSKEKINQERNAVLLETSDYFNPTFHKTRTGYKPLPDTQLEKLAKQVRKSVRFFGTNESLLYSTFSSLFNKVNISQLSEMYYKLFEKDMKSDILNDLSEKEKSKLYSIIDTLPNA